MLQEKEANSLKKLPYREDLGQKCLQVETDDSNTELMLNKRKRQINHVCSESRRHDKLNSK